MKRLHDCDSVTLMRAVGTGPVVPTIEDERTAVDFFADERARRSAALADAARADQGRTSVSPWETAVEGPTRAPLGGGRSRGKSESGRTMTRRGALPASTEADAKADPLRAIVRTIKTFGDFGVLLLSASVALVGYLSWPEVRGRSMPAGFAATATMPVAPKAPPSCVPIPPGSKVSPTPAPSVPPLAYDERAAAEAFVAALAAAHPSDETYREAARILRGGAKGDGKDARR